MFYNDKTVLVTGGAGFVGTHFVRALLAEGAKVRATIHNRPMIETDPGVELVQADLTCLDDCLRACQGVDFIFHAAGAVSAAGVTVSNPMSAIATNLILTVRILEAAWSQGVARTLIFSSGTTAYPAYDHPVREEEMWSGPTHPVYFGYGWMRRYLERLGEFVASKSPMIKDAVLRSFAGKNVLVTGGTGLIGRQVVAMLADAGANVRIVSLDHLTVHGKAEHVYGDLTDLGLCLEVSRDMDYVCHMAGIKGSIDVTIKKPASHFVPALMFNTNMLEASRRNKVAKLVYTSSIGAYASAEVFREGDNENGPPMDFYAGWAKRMAEFQIKTYRIQYGLTGFGVVRPCNVYGPGDNFDPDNAM